MSPHTPPLHPFPGTDGDIPPLVVAAFYRFVDFPDCEAWVEPLRRLCLDLDLKGTVLLAPEGINATVAGARSSVAALLAHLAEDARFADLAPRESRAVEPPFHRLKVKLKGEIVTLGVSGVQPARRTGTRVDPATWHALLDDPEVLVLDVRNHYECAIGTFDNAVFPNTEHFRQFPAFVEDHLAAAKDRPVAMFCTGGIRCEKASSYLLASGFAEVYQLAGGVLGYLRQVPAEASRWRGECFVFDQRVSVDGGLRPGCYIQCFACRRPLSAGECRDPRYSVGLSCPHCFDRLSETQRAAFAERRRQVILAAERRERHVGAAMALPAQSPRPSSPRGD